MPKVCIVLATYNGERYLSRMLDSLAGQSRKADVVIAVDDGSTDSTVSILKKFQQVLPLQIFEQKNNCGHRVAFSKGLELARQCVGAEDLIALADQDDIWYSAKLEILERLIGSYSLIFGDAEVIDGEDSLKASSWRRLARIPKSLPTMARIAGTNNVTGCLSMFKASLLDQILPIPEGVSFHDGWIGLLASKKNGITTADSPVVKYRLHDKNAIGLGHRYSFDETVERQRKWFFAILDNANRLGLNQDEQIFAEKSLKYWNTRASSFFLFRYLPWLISFRRVLFPDVNFRLPKIVFSVLGGPAVHLIFGKNK